MFGTTHTHIYILHIYWIPGCRENTKSHTQLYIDTHCKRRKNTPVKYSGPSDEIQWCLLYLSVNLYRCVYYQHQRSYVMCISLNAGICDVALIRPSLRLHVCVSFYTSHRSEHRCSARLHMTDAITTGIG